MDGGEESSLDWQRTIASRLAWALRTAWLLVYVGGGAYWFAQYAVADLAHVPSFVPAIIVLWIAGYFVGCVGVERFCLFLIAALALKLGNGKAVDPAQVARPFSPAPIITSIGTILLDCPNLSIPHGANRLIPGSNFEFSPTTATARKLDEGSASNYLSIAVDDAQFKESKYELQST